MNQKLACSVFGVAFGFALALGGCSSEDSSLSTAPIGPPHRAQDAGAGDATVEAGSDAAGGGEAGAVTAQSACAHLASARCKRSDACSGGAQTIASYGSEATCESRTAAQCASYLTAPGTSDTPDRIDACATSIATQSCGDFFDGVATSACAPAAGMQNSGAACFTNAQCATTYCAIGASSSCGACAPLPKAGDACAIDAQCGERSGLACSGGVCIAVAGLNAGCSASIPCAYGLACVGASSAHAGTCQTPSHDAGAACDPAIAGECDPTLGLTCEPSTKTCEPVRFADAGAPCGELEAGVTSCAMGTCVIATPDAGAPIDAGLDAADAAVDAEAGAAIDAGGADAGAPIAPTVGACVASVLEGIACDRVKGPSCVPPATCVAADGGTSGTCAIASSATCK